MMAVALVRPSDDPGPSLIQRRRERVHAWRIDRQVGVEAAKRQPPSPPETEAGEERIARLRQRAPLTRLEALRALLKKCPGRAPVPIRPEGLDLSAVWGR